MVEVARTDEINEESYQTLIELDKQIKFQVLQCTDISGYVDRLLSSNIPSDVLSVDSF